MWRLCILEVKFLTMKYIIILVIGLISITCNAQSNNVSKVVDVTTFKKKITNKNIQLIDVRTPEEYSEGHIQGAILIDFFSEDFKKTLNKLNKKRPVYVYCKSGGRSGKTSEMLADMGFTEIVDLEGGFLAWKKNKI